MISRSPLIHHLLASWAAVALLAAAVTAHAKVTFELTFTDAEGTGWKDATYGAQARAVLQQCVDGVGAELPYNATVKIRVWSYNDSSVPQIAGSNTLWAYTVGNVAEHSTWGIITGDRSRPSDQAYDAVAAWNFGKKAFTGSDGLLAVGGMIFNHEMMHMLGCLSRSDSAYTRFDAYFYDSADNPHVLNGARNPAADRDDSAYFLDVNGNKYVSVGDLVDGIYYNTVWKDQHRLILKTMGYRLAPKLAGSSAAGGVNLSWTSFSWADGYVLKRATSSGGPYTTIYSGTNTSFTDAPGGTGQTYYYVASYTKSGLEDGNSLEFAATVFAGPPPNVTATTNGSQVALTWSGLANATGYTIYRASSLDGPFTSIGTSPTTTFTDTTAQAERAYYYAVTGTNGGSESPRSATAWADTFTTAPAAPTSVAATPDDARVTLKWVTPAGAAAYQVKRAVVSGGLYTLIGTTASTAFTDGGLANDLAPYYYVVVAVNHLGESGNSTEVGVIPHRPATISKAENTSNLNEGASWVGGIPPGGNDLARWSGLAAASVASLGTDVSFKGIAIATTGGAVSIGGSRVLTLGSAGIDMGAATQNLAISSGVALAARHQIWNVASGRTLTLNTGTFARSASATLNIQGAGTVTSTLTGLATNTNSIIGPWATSGTGANTKYATFSGSTISGLTGTTATNFGWTSSNPNTMNYNVSGATTNLGANRSANTARYIGADATQNWGNNNTTTITLNGLMNAGTGTLTFSQAGGSHLGLLVIGANNNNELVLTAANAPLSIALPIVNTASNAGTVTVAGPNTVTLSGANTFSGGLNLNSGTLAANSDSALGTGTLALNGGTLTNTGAGARTLANSVLVNGSAAITSAGNSGTDLTLIGNISGDGSLTVSATYNATTFTLSGNNSGFAGKIIVNGANNRLNTGTAGSAGARWQVDGGLMLNAVGGATYNLGELSSTGSAGGISGHVNGATQTLIVGALNTTSTFSGVIVDNPTNTAQTGSVDGVTTSVLALTKVGAGTLTLAGNNSYTGATSVNAGALLVNGALSGGGTVTVAGSAALGGLGTVSGPVVVGAGGVLAPGGSSAGVLTLAGTLTLGNGSTLNLQLDTPGNSDRVVLGGSAPTVNGKAVVNITALAGFGAGTYPIVSGASAINSADFTLGTAPSGYLYDLSANGGTLSVIVTAPVSPLDAWRQAYFGTTGNSGDAADDADPDGDGMTNVQEWSAATNPIDKSDALKAKVAPPTTGSGMVVRFLAKAGRSYVLEYKDDLGAAQWQTIATYSPAEDGLIEYADLTAGSHRFYRVRTPAP